jgi:hypothetical protein
MGKRSWLGWLAVKPRVLDLQAFRERVAAAVLERHPAAEIERVGDETLVVDLDGKSGGAVLQAGRLHGLYRECPEDLDRLVEQLAAAAEGAAAPATLDSLRVLVRPATYLFPPGPGGDTQLSRPIAGDLLAFVAVDAADSISFPTAAALRDELGLDSAMLWERALANTRAGLPEIELPEATFISVIICDGSEATSALADDYLWDRLDADAADGVLVLPAEKNALAVMAGFSAEAIPALREVLAIAEVSPDYLSSMPLTRRGGRWIEAAELDAAFAPRGFKH